MKVQNTVLYDCIQYLLLQKLKQNSFKDFDGSLLKMFEKTLHMFPGNYNLLFKLNVYFKFKFFTKKGGLSSWSSFSKFLNSYEIENRDFKSISVQLETLLSV